MDEKLATAEKKVLVELVKLAQKRGLKGTQGEWKDFLKAYDKRLGNSLSDPSKRKPIDLVSFLKTFTKEDDLKLFHRVLKVHCNRNKVEQFFKQSLDNESPEQKLVRLTVEHPEYALDYSFPSADEGWIVTKLPKRSRMMKSNAMVAVDCEMVLCEDGSEAVVRVCVVDRDLQVKIDEFVNPNKAVIDYRTEITGITAGDLDGVTCSLADIQKSMKKLLSNGTILVGHSLHNDLQVLKIDHARVIDTSYIFKYMDAPISRRPSLCNLCKSVLGYELRKRGDAHNCLDDAHAAMKLVLAKLEHGDIPLVQDDDTGRLLLHKIPINVQRGEISRVLGEVAIEVKPCKKAHSQYYSAFAVFNSPQEADRAYENIDGNEETDSFGLPQKLVTFQFSNGESSLYIRKIRNDSSQSQVSSKKRVSESEEKSYESKKLKTDQKTIKTVANSNQCDDHLKEIERLKQQLAANSNQCDDHLKEIERLKQQLAANSNQCDDHHLEEIERLKQQLKEKDFQIVMQDKIISNLQKKVDGTKKDGRKNRICGLNCS